jgi:UDP-galactopyranose mutase
MAAAPPRRYGGIRDEAVVMAVAPEVAAAASVEPKAPDVIIGGGPTGLSAAYHLGPGSLLLEREPVIGGLCRSIEERGYTFDHAGHIMFSNDPYVLELYGTLLGDNVHWQNREAWIHNGGIDTRYPFQSALYGLPPEVLKECLIGAIEAHFGPLPRKARASAASGSSGCAGKAESITDCCADGTVDSRASGAATARGRLPRAVPRNFEEFIYSVWGAGVAKHFAIPYNRKLWAVPLDEIETSWLGGRVPLPDLEEMIEGALQPVPKPVGPNARFGYPLHGGFQALMNAFLPHLRGAVKVGTEVVRVSPSEHRVTLRDGSSCRYHHLISTAPLPKLIEMIGNEAPPAVHEAARQLRHVSVRCVNLGVARTNLTEKHWIYYPGTTVFHRIFVQGNASPHCNPPGGFGLTCEITYGPTKPLPCEGDKLIELCIADCIRVGLLAPDDRVEVRNEVDMPYAYVVYDHSRQQNVDLIRSWLEPHDIILAGRYAQWEYYNSDHAFLAGKQAAERILAKRAEPVVRADSRDYRVGDSRAL